ncbi:hypothetical protein BKA64DRAFT_671343 [Cadophora sp. MPI-SDFR-AT-0126]|nr:hypothetical protein BKA64DRAFT_671343 [Leotiomycetes sp. MPI-SDFR-AT-0126]
MDVGVAAGAVGIAITALRMLVQLNSVYNGVYSSPYEPPKKILSELPILISLLRDIQSKASNSYTEHPPTVSVALQISVERFGELMDCLTFMGLDQATGQPLPGKRRKVQQLVHRIRWTTHTEELQEATRRFRSALTLLRDIAMDHRTHDLITQQQSYLSYEFDYTRSLIQKKHRLTSPEGFVDSIPPDIADGGPKMAEDTPPHRFQPGSGTLFSVTFFVDVPAGDRPQFYAARAKYDTGCPDCLITEAVIRKHQLEGYLQTADPERLYTGLANTEVRSSSQIQLNWSANNETLSRRHTFYVVPDSPFELLLGEHFMTANSPLLPALPVACLLKEKTKAQKKAEADKEEEDNRKAEELTAQRRRGKAPERAVRGGTTEKAPDAALSSPAAEQPRATSGQSSSSRPQLAPTGSANLEKPTSMETVDSGYISDPVRGAVLQSSSPRSMEQGSSFAKGADGSQAGSKKPERAAEAIASDDLTAIDVPGQNANPKKNRWLFWR